MPDRDDAVDALFAEARVLRIEPSEALMARVLADAMTEQPKAVAVVPVRPRGGWLAGLADLFGGFGGLAGVGGAAVAGLVLGFVQPAPVTEFADAVWGVESVSVDLVPTAETLLAGE